MRCCILRFEEQANDDVAVVGQGCSFESSVLKAPHLPRRVGNRRHPSIKYFPEWHRQLLGMVARVADDRKVKRPAATVRQRDVLGVDAYVVLRVAHARPAAEVQVARGPAAPQPRERQAVAIELGRTDRRAGHGAEAPEEQPEAILRHLSRPVEEEGGPAVRRGVAIAVPEDRVVLLVQILHGGPLARRRGPRTVLRVARNEGDAERQKQDEDDRSKIRHGESNGANYASQSRWHGLAVGVGVESSSRKECVRESGVRNCLVTEETKLILLESKSN